MLIAVSYTHLDVYKRQFQITERIRQGVSNWKIGVWAILSNNSVSWAEHGFRARAPHTHTHTHTQPTKRAIVYFPLLTTLIGIQILRVTGVAKSLPSRNKYLNTHQLLHTIKERGKRNFPNDNITNVICEN